MKRREFLGAMGGIGVLSLGFDLGCGTSPIIKHATTTGELAPNVWVTVRRDGKVTIAVEKAEIGQGITTMYATLVAEDLDVPLESVEAHYADSKPEYRTFAGLLQMTGGSMSTREGYLPIRRAATSAREMLIGAAAAQWNCPRSECRTEQGFVVRGNDRLAYGDLTVKAAEQPVPSEPKLKPRAEFKLIGKHDRRVDLRAKIDGSAKFGIDVNVPNMARAWAIHPPVFGANATAIHAEKARAIPGFIDVVQFPGGVAVVAEKTWQALAASKVVDITWDAGLTAGLDTDKMRTAVRDHEGMGEATREDGKPEKQIQHHSEASIDVVYEAPYLCHAPMEPQNCTVHVRKDGIEVWAPHQAPTIIQAALGETFGFSMSEVLVHTTLSGGGFGRRTPADSALEAAHVSKKIGRPVQLIWSRESDFTQGQYRPFLGARMRGGVAKGKVTGVNAHVLGTPLIGPALGMFRSALPLPGPFVDAMRGAVNSNTVTDSPSTEGISDTSYELENIRVGFTPIRAKMPVMFWRSVGHSFNGFVMESFVDELAYAAKADPFEFRRRMVSGRAKRVLEACAQAWTAPKARGIGRGIARHTSFESEVAEVADVEIVNGRIRVRRVHVVVDCGLVVNPDIVRAQMEGGVIFGLSAALEQEITIKDGRVQQTNFDTFKLLRMHECPEITVTILDSDAKPTGVGEPGLPPIAPAVANAIFALTGRRLRRLPLQKELEAS